MTVGFLTSVVVPAVLLICMAAIGVNLRLAAFEIVLRRPLALLAATLAQFAILPLVGLLIVLALGLGPEIGLVLFAIAAAPGGGLSNLMTQVARGRVELSVTLTVASTILCIAVSPAIMAVGVRPLALDPAGIALDPARVALDMVRYMLVPLAVGIAVRHFFPRIGERIARRADTVAFAAVVLILILSVMVSGSLVLRMLRAAAVAGGLFCVAALSIGFAGGAVFGGERTGRVTLAIEFAIRNLPVAFMLIAGTSPDVRSVAFAVAYFIVSTSLVLVFGVVARSRRALPVN